MKWDAFQKIILHCRIHKVSWNPPENRKLMRSQLAERSDANRPEGPLKFRRQYLFPSQFWISGETPRYLVDPGMYLVHSCIIFTFEFTLIWMVALISVL